MSLRGILIPVVAAASLAALWGCGGDNPTGTHVPDSGVTVAVSTDPGEARTLSPVTFHASVTQEPGGMMMMGLQMMQMEVRLEGTDPWEPVDMSWDGDEDDYDGTCVFTSSGDYEVRAMGMMHGSHHMDEMYHMNGPFHVDRAHLEAGGYRVEFESFPGHLHTGAASMLRFWVLEPGSGGSWSPVAGLAPTIRVTESGRSPMDLAATESEDGMYQASHTFAMAGMAKAALLFRGADGADAAAEFTMPGPDRD